jgi:hypothetical protein
MLNGSAKIQIIKLIERFKLLNFYNNLSSMERKIYRTKQRKFNSKMYYSVILPILIGKKETKKILKMRKHSQFYN